MNLYPAREGDWVNLFAYLPRRGDSSVAPYAVFEGEPNHTGPDTFGTTRGEINPSASASAAQPATSNPPVIPYWRRQSPSLSHKSLVDGKATPVVGQYRDSDTPPLNSRQSTIRRSLNQFYLCKGRKRRNGVGWWQRALGSVSRGKSGTPREDSIFGITGGHKDTESKTAELKHKSARAWDRNQKGKKAHLFQDS